MPRPLIDGTAQELELHLPPLSRGTGGERYTEPGSGEKTRFRGYLRSGDLVAYHRVDGYDAGFPHDMAVSVIEAAAVRLRSAD